MSNEQVRTQVYMMIEKGVRQQEIAIQSGIRANNFNRWLKGQNMREFNLIRIKNGMKKVQQNIASL